MIPARLDLVLHYARQGWAVFRLAPGTKVPFKSTHGVHEATTDEATLTAWWTSTPDANIGVATGAASGFDVLDVDAHKGGTETLAELEGAHGPLPETVEQLTPHGGRHLLFQHVSGLKNCANLPGAPAIDVRTTGGYIVVEPSSLADTPRGYAWEATHHPEGTAVAEWPAWLLERVPRHATKAASAPPAAVEEDTRTVERARAYLARIPGAVSGQGGHARTFYAACRMVLGFALPTATALRLLVEEYNPRCSPPWTEAELRHKVADADTEDGPRGLLLQAAPLGQPAQDHVTEVTEAGQPGSSVAFVTDFGPLVPLPVGVEPPPFPVEALPHWLACWVNAQAEALQCPPDLPAVLALAVVALASAGKRRVRVSEGHYEPLNIYAAVALPSGEKKSPAFRAALEPVRDWEAEERRRVGPERDLAVARKRTLERCLERAQRRAADGQGATAEVDNAAEALSRHRVPVLPQLVAEDVTPDRLGMLMAEQGGRLAQFSDEGAPLQVLAGRYSDKGANLELFNKAHTQTAYICDRVTREGVRIERPTLTVGLAVQPDVIAGLAADRSFRYTGTLARFLFSLPVSRLGERDPNPAPVSPAVRAEYLAGVRSLLALEAPLDDGGEFVPQTLEMDSTAHARLVVFRAELEPRLKPDGDLRWMADWVNKAAGSVVRVAGLLHLSGRAPQTPGDLSASLSVDDVERGVRLVEYFLTHAQLAFQLMEATPETTRQRTVVKWLRRTRPERASVRAVQRALHLEDAEQARRVLDALEGRGYVRRAEHASPRAPGRPSEDYVVNPATWAEPATPARSAKSDGRRGDLPPTPPPLAPADDESLPPVLCRGDPAAVPDTCARLLGCLADGGEHSTAAMAKALRVTEESVSDAVAALAQQGGLETRMEGEFFLARLPQNDPRTQDLPA
jgi:hypothetical protein